MSELSQANRIYCVGLKGVGMTGLAQLLQAQGKEVWGSDTAEKFFTDEVLRHSHIECLEGFSATHLERKIDIIIRSTAYDESNIEVKTALDKKIPVITYPEALGEFTRERRSVAVAGSHGKTTTSALLAHVLKIANLSPSALVGSNVPQFQGNALAGPGDIFVFEADEYQNKFKYFSPQIIVLTSIDWDHPDFFATREEYFTAFVEFLKKLPPDGFVVACYDNEDVKRAVAQAGLKPEQIVSYGLQNGFWQMLRMWLDEGRWHFSVNKGEEFCGDFWLRLIGSHNVSNALAVVACASRLGVDFEFIRQGLASFEGTSRRLEIKGKLTNGVTVIDDYAHHPAEIIASLKAVRNFYPYKTIRCIFQPHTFSRTKAFLPDFAKAFTEADEVVILETYASAREQGGGVNAENLASEVTKNHSKVSYQSDIAKTAEYLISTAGRSDVVITMGAGDVWQVGEELIKKFGKVTGSEY
jgi:UDP-N-acetylmuramate--alanine ligase